MESEKEMLEIDVLAMLRAVWKRVWWILGAALAGATALFLCANFLITPLYHAKAMLYVNNSSISLGNTSFSISSGELSAAQSLVDTYIVILKSRLTLNAVIEHAQLDYTCEELESMICASAVNGTEIFEIVVTSEDPDESERIANTIAQLLPQKISDIVEGSSVKIVDYAVVPAYPVSPSVTRYTAVGFLTGGMLCVVVVALMEIFSSSIRSEDYLLQNYDLPVLAIVPVLNAQSKGEYRYQGAKRRT